MGGETETYTFTKRAPWFDAPGLRASMQKIARLSVELAFAVTGEPERLEEFRAAVAPSKGTIDWIQLLTSG